MAILNGKNKFMKKIQALTFLAPILDEKVDLLRSKLVVINKNLQDNKYISFAKIPSIHFARVVIIDNPNKNDKYKYVSQLLIATNYNGTLKNHVKELLESGNFIEILSHCKGFCKDDDVYRFIKKHANYRNYYYTSTWGRTSREIIQEEENRKVFEKVIDKFQSKRLDAKNMFLAIQKEVLKSKKFVNVTSSGSLPTLYIPVLFGISLLLTIFYTLFHFVGFYIFLKIIGYIALVFTTIIATSIVYLRFLERKDAEYDGKTPLSLSVEKFMDNEDLIVQNQFTSVVEIKDGFFRKILLRCILCIIGFLSHYLFNKGKLGTIPTIHFARWVIIDRGRRLLFLSNFDGSWENYLGDFIDKAAIGLTAVWSNTKLFPKSEFLIYEGALDEERFKAVARLNQVKTDVWYSAYPYLSVVNKNRNSLISKGLNNNVKAKIFLKWLREICYIKEPPKINKKNIQGLVLDSYGRLPFAKYLFIEIVDVVNFKKWLEYTKFNSTEYRPKKYAINIAFSKNGLEKLGVSVDHQNGFSSAFIEGIDTPHRNRILGDFESNSSDKWVWGNKNDKKLHALLLVYAKDKTLLQKIIDCAFTDNSKNSFRLRHKPIAGNLLKKNKEHFGFSDGISQPAINGISSKKFLNDIVEPGEFILGYSNNYGKYPNQPEIVALKDRIDSFGDDGSYMVYRQLKQNVSLFWENMLALSHATLEDITPAVLLASKIVGRKLNGDPLIEPIEDKKLIVDNNKFNYKEFDEEGEKCPLGSHIRRANPRDSLSLSKKKKDRDNAINIVKNHRILRRGRPYGLAIDDDMDINAMLSKIKKGMNNIDNGLNFICFNTNIERQFEFIQHTWINNPKFHDLYDEVDPLIGLQSDTNSDCPFSVQESPLRKRYTGLKQFVEVIGASYFFFPSISAIKQLSKLK